MFLAAVWGYLMPYVFPHSPGVAVTAGIVGGAFIGYLAVR